MNTTSKESTEFRLRIVGGIMAVCACLASCNGRTDTVGSVTPVEDPSDPVNPPNHTGQREETNLERVTRLFAQEPVEAAWAQQHEYKLRQAYATLPGTSVRRIDCRTTLCRLELEFTDPSAVRNFNRESAKMAGNHPENMFDATATVKDFDESTLKGTLFITRGGYSIPNADGTPVRFSNEPVRGRKRPHSSPPHPEQH